MTTWRVDWVPFQLDMLDFVAERIEEARSSAESQLAAITELAGAVRFMKERLREPGHEQQRTQATLFDWIEPWWWMALGKMNREAFLKASEPLIDSQTGFVPVVRGII